MTALDSAIASMPARLRAILAGQRARAEECARRGVAHVEYRPPPMWGKPGDGRAAERARFEESE